MTNLRITPLLRHPGIRLLVATALIATCAALDYFRTGPLETHTFVVPAVDLRPPAAGPDKTVSLPAASILRQPNRVEIEFSFLALADDHVDLFQTSDGSRALRLELIRPHSLLLVAAEGNDFKVASDLPSDTWQHIRLIVERARSIELLVDGRRAFFTTDARLTKLGFEFDEVVVGTGFAQQRNFVGEIRDFKLTGTSHRPRPAWQLAAITLLGGLAVTGILFAAAGGAGSQAAPLPVPAPAIAVVGVAAVLAALAWGAFSSALPPGKWHFLLFPALLFLLPGLWWRWKPGARLPGGRTILVLLASVAICWISYDNWRLLPPSSRWLLWGFGAIVWGVTFVRGPAQDWRLRVDQAEGTALGALVILCGLSPTGYWTVFSDACAEHPATTLAGLAVVVSVLMRGLAASPTAQFPASPTWLARLAVLLPYAIFALFALRFDSLFEGGSTMHWEYYVGPIRTLRSGGWLLWDTPSQYGFLNILLPALLPVKSAWQSFYLFQAGALFAAASLCYRMIRPGLGGRSSLATLVTVVAFYYADAALIGPSLFPSSSAVRFLWVYVLLHQASVLFSGPDPSLANYVRRTTWIWLVAVAWSAESCVYGTAIFGAPVVVAGCTRWLNPAPSAGTANPLVLLVRPVLWLAGLLVAVGLYYLWQIGQVPDFAMHFLYSTNYAQGFGEMPFHWSGPQWIFSLLLALGAGIVLSTRPFDRDGRSEGLVAVSVMAAAWAIASYYVGRSVHQNITALLPLLTVCALALYRLAARHRAPGASLCAGAALVFVLVPLAGFCAAIGTTAGLNRPQFGHLHIDDRLHRPDAELGQLLVEAGVKPESAVTYYGFNAAMPRTENTVPPFSYTHNWLPNPLQLLEAPIPPAIQERILHRYLSRHHEGGFLVQARGQFEERFDRWRQLLADFYVESEVHESPQYRVILFRRK